MTNSEYLLSAGWKCNDGKWRSRFIKTEYDEAGAMEVEFMLKGRAYVLMKKDGIGLDNDAKKALHEKPEDLYDEIPESFHQGLKDVEEGRTMDLDKALNDEYDPGLDLAT